MTSHSRRHNDFHVKNKKRKLLSPPENQVINLFNTFAAITPQNPTPRFSSNNLDPSLW